MLNVLHGRFVANPAQNSPSHIMKGKKAQMSTVSHWDWIRHPHLTLLIHTRPRSLFLSLLHATGTCSSPCTHVHTHTHTESVTQQILHPAWRGMSTHTHLSPSPSLWCLPADGLVNLTHWFEGKGQRAVEVYICEIAEQSRLKINSCNAAS